MHAIKKYLFIKIFIFFKGCILGDENILNTCYNIYYIFENMVLA